MQLQTKKKSREEGSEAGDQCGTPDNIDPRQVIESLVESRHELDILVDVVSLSEQRQFLSLTHVPHRMHPRVAQEDISQRVEKRKRQLNTISARLRDGVEKLRAKQASHAKFLEEMMHLRSSWRLEEYVGVISNTNCFVVDIRFNVEHGEGGNNALGKGTFVVLSTEEGQPCALLPNVEGHDMKEELVTGREAIHGALCRLETLRAWRLIRRKLVEEADSYVVGGDFSVAMESVLSMSERILDRIDPASHKNMKPTNDNHTGYVRPTVTHGRDVATFVESSVCLPIFEQKALQALANLISWERVPYMVKCASHDVYPGMLRELAAWLAKASLYYTMYCAIHDTIPDATAWEICHGMKTTNTVCVKFFNGSGEACGTLTGDLNKYTWEGSDSSGSQFQSLLKWGRVQLQQLLEKFHDTKQMKIEFLE